MSCQLTDKNNFAENKADRTEAIMAEEKEPEVMKPEDGENIFLWKNISVSSAEINWNNLRKSGKRIRRFYVELSDVKDKGK
jgi:hypothetical protein